MVTAKRKFLTIRISENRSPDLPSLVSHRSMTNLAPYLRHSPPKSPLPKSMPLPTTSLMTSQASRPLSFTPPARKMHLSHIRARVRSRTLLNLSRRMVAMALMLMLLLLARPATTLQRRTSRQQQARLAKMPALRPLVPRKQLRVLSGQTMRVLQIHMMSCKHGNNGMWV